MKSVKQKVGQVGEDLASKFLESKGYRILDRNYRKKWGEIDIIAEKDDIVHFIEVKANSVSSTFAKASADKRETYMPEDNVRLWKKQRLSRAIRTYLLDKKIGDEQEFQIDVLAVFLDFGLKKAKFRLVENVLLH